jgi:C4-type Zn-finger protein
MNEKKWISEEIENLKNDYHPHVIIILECTDQGNKLNGHIKVSGQNVIIQGLLSNIDNVVENIEESLYTTKTVSANGDVSEMSNKLIKLKNILKKLDPSVSEKFIEKWFGSSAITSLTLEELDEIITEAEKEINKSNDFLDYIK